MKLNLSKEWYKRAGTSEEGLSVTAGVRTLDPLLVETSQYRRTMARKECLPHPFARLINLQRRARQLSMEALAEQADIDLVELYNIEHEAEFHPEPGTVFQLAETLELPEDKLLELSGLTMTTDNRFREEAIRFAARSEPVERLSPEEHEALSEFVKYLSEA
jgi:transcriptional regulator with XRE-family HTH domain